MVSSKFELATIEVEKVNSAPSNDDKLLLYAYFKIAHATNFASATKPGTFDFVGKAKYNAWKKEVDAGVTPAQAEQKYIDTVEDIKKKCGYDTKRTTQADGKAIAPEKLKRFEELAKA